MDVDIDMDVDYDDIPATQPVPEESATLVDQSAALADVSADSITLVPNKVNISGLDDLSEADVKAFVTEHFSEAAPERVEWVNDTSANLVYQSEDFALDALLALSSAHIEDPSAIPPGENIPAKSFASKPFVSLAVRFAVVSDRKVPGAAKYSRYYLLHPDDGPEERNRRREKWRRYRDRDERDRHRDEVPETFDATMYDDENATLAERATRNGERHMRQSRSSSRGRRNRSRDKETGLVRGNKHKELFPEKPSRRGCLRDRSLSPRLHSRGDETTRKTSSIPHISESRNKSRASSIRERWRESSHKELFPEKLISSGKSQLDRADEMANKMSQFKFTPPAELHIRGIAKNQEDGIGIAIKGRAAKSVKELFPGKFGENASEELFSDRLVGRGGPRRKAEDLFL